MFAAVQSVIIDSLILKKHGLGTNPKWLFMAPT